MVRGEPDKDSLPAAALGAEQFSRGQIGVHADGVRAVEVVDSFAKTFFHGVTAPQVALDLQGNHFGIGSDFWLLAVSSG